MQIQSSKVNKWRTVLEIAAAIAGVFSLFVALGQWLIPNTTVKGVINLVSIKILLIFSLAIITALFLSILFRLVAKPRKLIFWATICLYIATIMYAVFVGSLTSVSSGLIFSLDQANASKLYPSNGAQVSNQGNHAIELLGYWDQAVWIDQELPDDFRATITFKTADANSLNIGLGDGSNVNPSFLLVNGNSGGIYFVRWDKDIWNRATTPLTNETDTIRPFTRYIVVLERKNNLASVSLNGGVLLENIRIPPDMRSLNHLYLTTNFNVNNENKVGSSIIENIIIEKTD